MEGQGIASAGGEYINDFAWCVRSPGKSMASHGACMCPDCGKPQMTEGLMSAARAVKGFVKNPGKVVEKIRNASEQANVVDKHRIMSERDSNYTTETIEKYSADNVCRAVQQFLQQKDASISRVQLNNAIHMLDKYREHIVLHKKAENVPDKFKYTIAWDHTRSEFD